MLSRPADRRQASPLSHACGGDALTMLMRHAGAKRTPPGYADNQTSAAEQTFANDPGRMLQNPRCIQAGQRRYGQRMWRPALLAVTTPRLNAGTLPNRKSPQSGTQYNRNLIHLLTTEA
jgi:hypothetical protein